MTGSPPSNKKKTILTVHIEHRHISCLPILTKGPLLLISWAEGFRKRLGL